MKRHFSTIAAVLLATTGLLTVLALATVFAVATMFFGAMEYMGRGTCNGGICDPRGAALAVYGVGTVLGLVAFWGIFRSIRPIAKKKKI